ncbi:uncharacterized protein Z518_07204 [Rhinocladiella mackenziei CBS 650.93]|uniref:Rhinocladiella mackenziei CBS 650.93 unplaced genomic scaffold supercont1.5, whole genome shotgun sequence n=1 Tax=Rhinocladiella mackenziei CBS 650.93 TaxID=1442369 RepID=A0A0D2IK87_9EURO|nr:uncharacterized protein Z518_07204 [Rhinocladiella mackenziei CBS 650.93]KIX03651.1 hypothetical protein Z518_07204 [Rhinocladiella mackenziei CBS 650.93]
MLGDIPQEIFEHIIHPLEPPDLKALRMVNRGFREELQYQEMKFEDILSEDDPQQETKVEWFTDLILEFIVRLRSLKMGYAIEKCPNPQGFLAKDWDVPQSHPEGMIESVLQQYAEGAVLQKPRHLYGAFRVTLPRFENLQRIVRTEVSAGGIAIDYPRTELALSLQKLNYIFPVSDSAIRMTFRRGASS